MTPRANSFRNVLVDGGIVAMAMTALAMATALAYSQEINDLRPDPRTTDDAIDSRQNTDDNLPSGDPTETFVDEIQNQILGMTVFEDARGRAMVTDISATSPAWDAGIRKGDRILELADLRPTDFQKWSADVRRVLHDTEDGKSLPVEVARGDERLSLRVKLSESRVAEVRDARQEEEAIARERRLQRRQAAGQGTDRIVEHRGADQAPYGGHPGYGGGGFGFIGDDGIAATEDAGRTPTRAVAALFASGFSGRQVGFATFQNTDNGVGANVQVQGLPQGTYRVGIGDGSTGGFGNTAFDPAAVDPDGDGNFSNNLDRNATRDDPNRRREGRLRGDGTPRAGIDQNIPIDQQQQQLQNIQREQGQLPPAVMPGAVPGNQPNVPPMNVPGAGGAAPGAGGAPTGASSGESSSLAAPRGMPVLAQVGGGESGAAAGGSPGQVPQFDREGQPVPSDLNNAGGAQPGRTFAPGGVDATRTGNSTRSGIRRGDEQPGVDPNFSGGMPNFLVPIGMLTVGPNGTGQTQGLLNGMTVQNLAGMTVSVVPARNEANTGIGNTSPRMSDLRNAPGAAADNRLGQNQGQFGPNQGVVGAVATGIIRIVEGSGLPPGGVGTTNQDDLSNERARRANEELREQVERRQFTTPPDRSFDPNDPTR